MSPSEQDRLAREWLPYVAKFCSFMARRYALDREDVQSEGNAALLSAIRTAVSDKPFDVYLRAIINNRVIDMLRRKRLPMTIQEWDGPEESTRIDWQDRDAFEYYLEGLNCKKRALLRLFFLEGMTYQECAEETGVSIGFAHKACKEAIAAIRDKLEAAC